jgi:hypothetical protein
MSGVSLERQASRQYAANEFHDKKDCREKQCDAEPSSSRPIALILHFLSLLKCRFVLFSFLECEVSCGKNQVAEWSCPSGIPIRPASISERAGAFASPHSFPHASGKSILSSQDLSR